MGENELNVAKIIKQMTQGLKNSDNPKYKEWRKKAKAKLARLNKLRSIYECERTRISEKAFDLAHVMGNGVSGGTAWVLPSNYNLKERPITCQDDNCTSKDFETCPNCINRSVVSKAAYELMLKIEELPASELQTEVSIATQKFIELVVGEIEKASV